MTAAHTISATFAINTYTLTYTAGANGTITGTTPQTVNYGGSGTAVTAVPNTGYHFVELVRRGLTATRTDANVTANMSVTASFAINTYTLTYTAGANGTITGATPQTVNHGGNGTAVTAVPNTGYHFVSWSDGVTDGHPHRHQRHGRHERHRELRDQHLHARPTRPAPTARSPARARRRSTTAAAVRRSRRCRTPATTSSSWSDGVATAAAHGHQRHGRPRRVTASFAINTYTLTYTAGANGTITGRAADGEPRRRAARR